MPETSPAYRSILLTFRLFPVYFMGGHFTQA